MTGSLGLDKTRSGYMEGKLKNESRISFWDDKKFANLDYVDSFTTRMH